LGGLGSQTTTSSADTAVQLRGHSADRRHTGVAPLDRNGHLPARLRVATMMLCPIEDRDLTTVMSILGDIREDVNAIRELLEDDDGEEEETPEDHS
jgi:hypothetical protein